MTPRLLACLVASLLALAGEGSALAATDPVARPPLTFIHGDGSYTKASRTAKQIRMIVIHVTDGGSFDGNLWWLSGGHSHASANYVVSRAGQIVQLVNDSDIAWHAGNWKVNKKSIGIEHVGETDDPAGFTNAQYRASARLVAWLVLRYDIPVDRTHIIGHSQVPDPNHPGLFGGYAHHTDPGPYWRWGYYMSLIRHFAFPARYALHVTGSSIADGATLDEVVPWRVTTKGQVRRVDFYVDGELQWSDARAPYTFAAHRGWNTTALPNGTHELAIHVTGGGRSAWRRLTVHVENRRFMLTTSALHAWQKVHGTVRIRANARGARTTGIALYVDGHAVSRDRTAPFTLHWNSRSVRDGRHRITVAAVAADGRVAKRTLPLVVRNRVVHHVKPKATPKPKPVPAPLPVVVVSESIADGSTVSGTLEWSAHTTGPVARVVFAVDGTALPSSASEPWLATLDTSSLAPGTHALTVTAYARDDRSATLAATVTVAAAAAATPPSTTP